ncbi:MAG: hypothetical protein QXM51_00965 [Thermoproteota archaeon]
MNELWQEMSELLRVARVKPTIQTYEWAQKTDYRVPCENVPIPIKVSGRKAQVVLEGFPTTCIICLMRGNRKLAILFLLEFE